MPDPTAAFFEGLDRSGHEPLLEKTTGTLRFELTSGKQEAPWFVTIKKGDVAVSRADGTADCVARTDKTLFDGIVRGEENAMAAVLRGAMETEGDPELLVLFQRLFPGPSATGTPGRKS
jgi:putative sterol carrier protein